MDNIFKGREFLVLVRCMTYNQSKYILDALNGFVMQKTNFPFVCLVMDDASTDGEQEVIKGFLNRECAMESAEFSEIEEANIVVVPHKTNPNCTMAVYFLKKNLYGTDKKTPLIAPWRGRCKYEAMCEGDDYWTNPTKLKKQVDLLEADCNCGLCYSNCDIFFDGYNTWERAIFKDSVLPIDGSNPFMNTAHWYLANMTWIYRKEIVDTIPLNKEYIDGAIYLLLNICMRSKIVYLPEVTGVYRRHIGSASCFSKDQEYRNYTYQRNSFKLTTTYVKYFQVPQIYINSIYTDALFDLFVKANRFNDSETINYINSYFDNRLNPQVIFDKIAKYENELSKIKHSRIYWIPNKISKVVDKLKQIFRLDK